MSTTPKEPCSCCDSIALAELRIAIGRVIADYQSQALTALERDDPSAAAWYGLVADQLKEAIQRSSDQPTSEVQSP